MWFRRKRYDRSETLATAAKARAKGNSRKAIAEYRRALEQQPDDPVVLGKLAPLLAGARLQDEALACFGKASEGYRRQGFLDRAVAVWSQATWCLPTRETAWLELAALQVEKGRRPDALKTLLDGRGRFRARRRWPGAIALLCKALELEPFHLEATVDLARILRKIGERGAARERLVALEPHLTAAQLRRVRGELFRTAPSFSTFWGWLRPRPLHPAPEMRQNR